MAFPLLILGPIPKLLTDPRMILVRSEDGTERIKMRTKRGGRLVRYRGLFEDDDLIAHIISLF